MNTAEIVIASIFAILVILAVRRVIKHGAPCECGGNRKACSCCSACHGKRSESLES